MDRIKAIEFLEENKEFLFPNKEFADVDVEEALIAAPAEVELYLNGLSFRKPSTTQWIAVFPGQIGVDRFYLGDYVKGLLKWITYGGVGIWWIVDIITAKERCRVHNCKKLMGLLNGAQERVKRNNADINFGQAFDTVKKFAPAAKEIVKGAKDIMKTFDMDM